MSGTVHIANLRNIGSLTFDLPTQGVWLLTASNGAGKTSLLACLRRIGVSNAFPTHFPVSLESENLDNFSEGTITYTVNGDSVEYAYRGERWAPRPRANSHLLSKFGYPNVIYMGANAERLTPRPEDFIPRRIRPASTILISALNNIFETDKFDELKTVNLTTGVGNQVFVMRTSISPPRYHSEKQFSLGELCVMKLVDGIRDCANQSLVLIDELELALHPRAQIKLYEYLVGVAQKKRLTVIFSTHSVSLLKTVPRKNIFYLERSAGGNIVKVLSGCFPTYAIGNIALGEERAPDAVLYVEDEVARSILEPLVQLSLQAKWDSQNLFPDVRVVPIGPFHAVVKFLANHRVLLPSTTKATAILDVDVKAETVEGWKATNCYEQLADFDRLKGQIDYLPWTPEVGIVEFLRADRAEAERRLRSAFSTSMIWLDQSLLDKTKGLTHGRLRDEAKHVTKSLAKTIGDAVGRDEDTAMRMICKEFAYYAFEKDRAAILGLILPKIS